MSNLIGAGEVEQFEDLGRRFAIGVDEQVGTGGLTDRVRCGPRRPEASIRQIVCLTPIDFPTMEATRLASSFAVTATRSSLCSTPARLSVSG